MGKSALLDGLAGKAIALGGRLIRGGFERGCEEPLFALSLALSSLADPCPNCGSHQLQVTGGTELKVRELEIH